MLVRRTAFVLLMCATVANARPAETKLVGKWLWQGVDAQAVYSFQADHTFTLERTGFEHHDIQKGTWKVEGNRLTISWPDAPDDVRTIVKLTSGTLVLRWPAEGKQTYSRIK